MELIRITDGEYKRYEELLLQRDSLEKEALSYSMQYTAEFGDLKIELFSLQIDCIALKKTISFVIAAKNKGKEPDDDSLRSLLKRQMAAYRHQLEDMIKEHDDATKGKPLTPFEISEIKKIYRRIAKLLHPDLSPLTKDYPELAELFQRVMIAYSCNDLNELRDLEVLINKTLEDKGIDSITVEIPNIAERIIELEQDIETILTTEPYIYRDLLADPFKVEEKKKSLTDEIEEYKVYKAELTEKLKELTGDDKNWLTTN